MTKKGEIDWENEYHHLRAEFDALKIEFNLKDQHNKQ